MPGNRFFEGCTYIFMVDQLHEHKLSVCALGVCDVLEGPAEFLDGYILTYDSVIRSTEKTEKMTHKKMMNISDSKKKLILTYDSVIRSTEKQKTTNKKMMDISHSNKNYILTHDHVVRSIIKQRKQQVNEMMDISHTQTNKNNTIETEYRMMENTCKITDTLAHGYLSERTQ